MFPMLTAEAISPIEPFRFSRPEYHRLGESGAFAGKRVQLIRGTVITMSPMGLLHALAIRRLTKLFVSQAPDALVVCVQLPLAAAADSEPEPDFAFVAERDLKGDDHPSTAVLVVEVADSSLRLDLGPKADLYAECKVPEYWVVDLGARATFVHLSPRRGKYTSVHRVPWSRTLAANAVPEVSVRLAELLK
jgi:Uma2 family endonuclease